MPLSETMAKAYNDMYIMVNLKSPPEGEVSMDDANSLCDKFDNMVPELARELDGICRLEEKADRLEAELDSKHGSIMELQKRYDDYYQTVRQPYEESERDIVKAKSEYNQEISRLVSLEEKYHNLACLLALNHRKESLEQQESKIDRDIKEAKIRIHDYQHLNPNLHEEYRNLKDELEMRSLLNQMNISSASTSDS